jgi:hypothetical protein
MAVIQAGVSRCSICGETLHSGDVIVTSSAFVGNKRDPFWQFADSGIHKACFDSWDKGQEFAQRFLESTGKELGISQIPTDKR